MDNYTFIVALFNETELVSRQTFDISKYNQESENFVCKSSTNNKISAIGSNQRLENDLIVYDTYDYLDKLIGFKLSDIFYAVFYQYYEATSDECALRLAKYFKYGTDKEREIWMLRYGFSFEETELVSECIDFIDETEIKFNDRINALNEAQLQVIEQYVHE